MVRVYEKDVDVVLETVLRGINDLESLGNVLEDLHRRLSHIL